ncbi:MAG: hypothetical protein OER80_03090 [Gammaproteobacteria bacterium]|nr:hypothetical protein [Gammaproteobacteria bacterium]MDH3768672.1 hypothetical protein [Gammaproteobacteria bacterium]
MSIFIRTVAVIGLFGVIATVRAELVGEGPALGAPELRMSQSEVESGLLSLHDLRQAGLKIFGTQFNQYDGYGDGPMNPANPTALGGRPTLGGNGTFLRVNGLDAQSCNDCHGIVSSATVPATLGVGGAGGLNNAVMFMPTNIDVNDSDVNGHAGFNGRLIVPPALFGAGGIQLLAKEMTIELQALKTHALANPGKTIRLTTKSVDFGVLTADSGGTLDASGIEGIDADLVVRPFGRKGEFATARAFGQGAMMFHFGMQPVEIVGVGLDDDGDGVTDEILPGELSALEIFITTQNTPRRLQLDSDSRRGLRNFRRAGCTECHRPQLTTKSRMLTYSFPEIADQPDANVYYASNLAARPASFPQHRGGLVVQLFGDLKRHDMGYDLAENFQGASEQANHEFMTAELWGVADTGPYLHDGRALTLNAAILAHGGEAETARTAYANLGETGQSELLIFLRTLRNPVSPNADVLGIDSK